MDKAYNMGLMLEERDDSLYVIAVSSDSAASRIGFSPGDCITEINDVSVTTLDDFNNQMHEVRHADVVVFICLRDCEIMTLTFTRPQRH